MSDFKRLGQFGLMLAGAGIAILAYEAGRARAGVPTTQALVYSGYLTDDAGAPDDEVRDIKINLYKDENDATRLCVVSQDSPWAASGTFDLHKTQGRFSLSLADSCTAALADHTVEPWIEVRVKDEPLPRTKISAVPYAIEACNAATANALTPAALSTLKMQIKDDLKKELATPELSYPACPPGYAQILDDGVPWTTAGSNSAPDFIVCKSENGTGRDEVVRVGERATAFWIDRYEASLWTASSSSGTLLAGPPADFPVNGQVPRGKELFALSVRDVLPTGSLTWFQMAEACAASGKRLPTSTEWLRSGRGTHDPGAVDGHNKNQCHTAAPQDNLTPRDTNKAIGATKEDSCVSDWGAEDMIGNFYEMVEDWLVPPGLVTTDPGTEKVTDEHKNSPWLTGFNDDITLNVASKVTGAWAVDANGQVVGAGRTGLPAAEIRGGAFGGGVESGLFYIGASTGPTIAYWVNGFRCMIPR